MEQQRKQTGRFKSPEPDEQSWLHREAGRSEEIPL